MIDREYTRDEFFTLIRKRLNDALDGNHDDEKKERYEKEKMFILDRGLTREFAILYRITEFAKAENQVIYIDGWLHYFYCLFLLGVTDFGPFDFVENGYDLPFQIINPLPYTNFINIRCTATLLRAISNLYQCEVNYIIRDNPSVQIIGSRVRLHADDLVTSHYRVRSIVGDVPNEETKNDIALFRSNE